VSQPNKRAYHARFYVKNPGMAYDPAHLPEFDIEGDELTELPAPGDTVFSWAKSTGEDKGSNRYFKVVNRAYRFLPDEVFVFVLVESVDEQWPEKFS
jgi:hypothetical protein